MKKILFAIATLSLPMLVSAQSAVDANLFAQPDLRGTARFVSMGGAFGALGGDLSTLNQNPAGIGVYRGSEVGITLDVDGQSVESKSSTSTDKFTQTKFVFSNAGYVGTSDIRDDGSATLSWGVSYSRLASFNRSFRGRGLMLNGNSISNYIAAATNAGGFTKDDLTTTSSYDPYRSYPYAPWLSIYAYDSYLINPDESGRNFQGLALAGTTGDAQFDVREKGFNDEYSFDLGGSVNSTLYWGLGLGIDDFEYNSYSFYDEQLVDAFDPGNGSTGKAYFSMDNWRVVRGTGFNVKGGLIYRPTNEIRFGVAAHTPTWYRLRENYYTSGSYSFASGLQSDSKNFPETNNGYDADFSYNYRSPWKLILSAAGVISGRAIVSFDYEFVGQKNVAISDSRGEYTDITNDVHAWYRPGNIFRVGVEFKATPQFAIRAGYNYQTSPVKTEVNDNLIPITTSGMQTAYTFDNNTQYFTAGLGYRWENFYVDAAYVHKKRESIYHAFSPIPAQNSPTATITDNNNRFLLSLGFKF